MAVGRQAKLSVCMVLMLGVAAFPWTPAHAESSGAVEFPQCFVPMDILFLFDTTGSMGGVLASAKAGASSIMSNVAGTVPDVRFGVANYRDYVGSYSYPGYSDTYGSFGDYPWQFNLAMTTNFGAVQTAINGLSLGNGADWPESLSRALHESRTVNWRPAAIKIVVLFADAPPHDMDFAGQNFGGDPGPDAIAGTADDIDFETIVADLAARGIQYVVVDSGGGAAAAHFNHIATQTDGAYALLGGNFVQQVTDLILALAPSPSGAAKSAAVRGEVSVPANPYVQVVPATAGPAAGQQHGRLAHATLPPALDGFVTAANDGAYSYRATGDVRTRSNSTIEEFSILSGLVKGKGLHVVVESRTTPGATSASVVEWRFAELVVNGAPVSQDVPPNTVIPIPGVGFVVLRETKTASTGTQASEVLVNAVHVVVDTAQVRADVVVGSAYAASTCAPPTGILLKTYDNDRGTGGDAGNSPATATPVTAPAVFQGRLVESDRADFYRVAAKPGEKVTATLVPSSRAEVAVRPLPAAPATGVALPEMDLYLYEPGTFALRELSELPVSAPDRVELNVDVAGEWVIEARRASAIPGNYTLAITVTPILLNGQNDAMSGGDAPATCGAGPLLTTGAYTGVLRDSDYVDFYRVSVNVGDELAVALKPTEDADGADFDLRLYDGRCNLLQESTFGKSIIPKGTPDAVALAPAQWSDTYRIEVRRHNGIGNYYLAVDVTDPQPTVAPIDAEAGGDAGSSAATARPVSSPGVHQGRFPDGDAQDWYSFPVPAAGKRISVTLSPSALSDFDVYLVAPNGATTLAASATSMPVERIDVVSTLAGTHYLRMVRVSGGGDYAFTVAVQP